MRSRFLLLFSVSASLLLSGCHSHKPQVPDASKSVANEKEKPVHKDPHAPMTKEEIQAFNNDIGKAMSDIPPPLRFDFQKYLNCELKAHKDKILDAARIRQLTANLEKDRKLANCR